ncbi:hypothetical protein RHS01_11109 [Rhizoctonia solani]|uniref:Jacalin-type lectin domain-containing protein n=1 Tax=Rhizoctonia solani TaxID=456999 RepID=A0A8H7I0H5_9AGAM|nr:hypothetical protein RHS01_11109 [Rhizoctonia solani]
MSSSAEQKTTSFWSTLQKYSHGSIFRVRPKTSHRRGLSAPEDSDFLRGVTFNGPNGPYKSSRQVSRLRSRTVYSLKCCSDISTEEFYPVNDRDARYIHMGWPAPRFGPVNEFTKAIEEALKEPNATDQHEALRDIFAACELRDQCARLLSQPNALWRTPAVGAAFPFAFDGAALGVKDIKKIDIWYNGALVQDISFVYTDGAVSGPYGFGKTNKISDSFVLARGEFITDVFIWPYNGTIPAIQFIKNTTQISPRYGASSGWGEPIISTAGGSALLGLSGSFNTAQLQQLQESSVIDVKSDDYRAIATSSVGYGNGTMFNDYRFLGHPPTSRISAIEYRNTTQAIARFQASGKDYANAWYGCRQYRHMELEEDEFITQVSGRYNGTAIYRLEFTTSKGITKRMGQEFGEWFTVLPPKAGMVLYYMCGKTVGYIQTLTFVWERDH